MRVMPNYMFVRIDKAAQTEKREKIAGSTLYRHANYSFMQCNLQYGELVQIGTNAAKNFPEAQLGDYIIFHHNIEGDVDDANYERLIDKEPSGDEIRYLNADKANLNFEIFAILKKDTNELIPSDTHVFLDTKVRQYKKRPESSLLIVEEEVEDNEEDLRLRLERLTDECEKLKLTYQSRTTQAEVDDISRVLDEKYAERDRITRYLNAEHLASAVVFAINSKTSRQLDIKENDRIITIQNFLYPLEVLGQKFLLSQTSDVIAKIQN